MKNQQHSTLRDKKMEEEPKKHYINKKVKENLDIWLNDLVHSEMDLVILIDGVEGVGKSFTARSLGKYLAKELTKKGVKSEFTPKDIYFDLENYIDKSMEFGIPEENGNKIKINVLDEGRNALNRKRSNSKANVRFTNYLSECRQFRQVHIILLPAFHDLDPYIVLWRANCLFTFEKQRTEQGALKRGAYKFRVINKRSQNTFSWSYEHKYSYPKAYEARDWWSSIEVFTQEEILEYTLAKQEASRKKYYSKNDATSGQDETPVQAKKTAMLGKAFALIGHFSGWTHEKIAEEFGYTQQSVSRIIADAKEYEKTIGFEKHQKYTGLSHKT